MTKKQREEMKVKLERGTTHLRGRKSQIPPWFESNPDALEVFDLWLEMKLEGTSDWPFSLVYRELRERGFPLSSNSLRKWGAANYGERWVGAMVG